jgi:erythromycin esterase-like protein
MHETLQDWIAQEAISFSLDSPASLDGAIDRMMAELGPEVELLGIGEAMHALSDGHDLMIFRNRLFERLVEAHGFSAIAVESSFPRGRLIDEFVKGRGPAQYDAVQEAGLSHGFGRYSANRELIEWMRVYNAEPSHQLKLSFYGFDSPTEMMGTDSPRQTLHFALDYLASINGENESNSAARRERIDSLLGQDADWENPAAMMDPTKSIGRSPQAAALRIEADDFVTELAIRRPELSAKSGDERFLEAMQHARVARWLLGYHAVLAWNSDQRIARCLGMRDALMAENLEHIHQRERGRGKVLAFAHNSHLKRGMASWQLGPHALTWWPAGAQLNCAMGKRFAVIGHAAGISPANGIGQPEPRTLEAQLMASPGPARLIATHRGEGLPSAEIAALPTRSGSSTNPGYFPLTGQSIAEFDWLVMV